MVKFFIFLLLIAAVAAGSYFFFFGEKVMIIEKPASEKSVYYYNNPQISLAKIKIRAFYFVPKDKKEEIYPGWPSVLEKALDELVSFHRAVFRGLSQVSFDIFPEAVVGMQNTFFYDTEKTDRGNPEALRNIYGEIGKRLLDPSGDLFNEDFVKNGKGERIVYCFVYQGVGAVGSENTMLVSLTYLTDENYKDVGTSVFYHEFAHTLGIPDHYDESGNPDSFDIMGFGLKRPLTFNYLDREILKAMGL